MKSKSNMSKQILAGLSPDQILERIRKDGATAFDSLVTSIASAGASDRQYPSADVLREQWPGFYIAITTILLLSGRSVTDLAIAIKIKQRTQ